MNNKEIYPKIQPEFKAKWVESLRSGKYKQGFDGYLYQEEIGSYCCLGVAGVVCGFSKRRMNGMNLFDEYVFRGPWKNILKNKIPTELQGTAEHNALVDKLILLNDNYCQDFNSIADFIEKNL